MENKEESKWEKVENHIVKWMVGFALTSIVVAVGFYYNTNHVMAQNTTDITRIKNDVKKVTTVPVLNQNKIKNIEKDIARIEKAQEDNHKEIKEDQKQMRKDLQKMLELLYQIKMNQNKSN